MVICGVNSKVAKRLCDVILCNWKDFVEAGFDPITGTHYIRIKNNVPVVLKYFAGDDANEPYISIWCGDKVCSLTYGDYIHITL